MSKEQEIIIKTNGENETVSVKLQCDNMFMIGAILNLSEELRVGDVEYIIRELKEMKEKKQREHDLASKIADMDQDVVKKIISMMEGSL